MAAPRIRIRKPRPKPVAKPGRLDAVVALLLSLEETLTGSVPADKAEEVKALYAALKEAV